MGKTSFAAKIPDSLLLAFEIGYHAIPGLKAVDIDKWATFKLVLKQLEKPDAKKMYKSVIIDTATIAYDYCEQYICMQNGVDRIGDIPYGSGFAACKTEFANAFRKLSQLGYGIVFISHAEKRIVKDEKDNEIKILCPDLQKRAAQVIEPMVDVIGMIDCVVKEDGSSERWLYTRKTPTIMAGSRWQYLDPKIPFGYEELVDAIGRAIEKEVEQGAKVSDVTTSVQEEDISYTDILEEARKLWSLFGDDQKRKVMEKSSKIFGHTVKLSEIPESQKDLFYLLLVEMRDM